MNERLRHAITVGVITAVVGIIAFGTAQALLANHEERDSVDHTVRPEHTEHDAA